MRTCAAEPKRSAAPTAAAPSVNDDRSPFGGLLVMNSSLFSLATSHWMQENLSIIGRQARTINPRSIGPTGDHAVSALCRFWATEQARSIRQMGCEVWGYPDPLNFSTQSYVQLRTARDFPERKFQARRAGIERENACTHFRQTTCALQSPASAAVL